MSQYKFEIKIILLLLEEKISDKRKIGIVSETRCTKVNHF